MYKTLSLAIVTLFLLCGCKSTTYVPLPASGEIVTKNINGTAVLEKNVSPNKLQVGVTAYEDIYLVEITYDNSCDRPVTLHVFDFYLTADQSEERYPLSAGDVIEHYTQKAELANEKSTDYAAQQGKAYARGIVSVTDVRTANMLNSEATDSAALSGYNQGLAKTYRHNKEFFTAHSLQDTAVSPNTSLYGLIYFAREDADHQPLTVHYAPDTPENQEYAFPFLKNN